MKQRKNFNKGLRLDLACCHDDLRPALQHLFIKDGFVYASNSYVLIANKLTECSTFSEDQIEALNGKYIHYMMFKDMIKCNCPFIDEDGIIIRENGFNKKLYFGVELSYPNVDRLVSDLITLKTIQESDFGLLINFFETIKKCLPQSSNITITPKGGYRYVIKSRIVEQESFAVLMKTTPLD